MRALVLFLLALSAAGGLLPAAVAQVPLVEAHVLADDFAEAMLEGEELFAGCSLGCAYGWRTTASSHLGPQGDNRYDVAMLEDYSPRTAWVEGVEGDGIGERLSFTILPLDGESEAAQEPVPFWGIDLVNGYAKTEATWEANGRVRELLLSINGDAVALLQLLDFRLPQSLDLPDGLEVAPGDVIALEIRGVYPGSRYADTAITEIVLHGAH